MHTRLLIALLAVLGTGSAHAEQMTIPLVADFENPTYTNFYEMIGSALAGTVVDGRLVVESTRQPGNGGLSHLGLNGEFPPSVFADITASFPEPTRTAEGKARLIGPGILVRDNGVSDARAYYAFLLQSDGYTIFAIANGSIRQTIGGSLDAATLAAPVHLAARETAAGAEFYVNGARVAELSDSAIDGHRVGLVVFGSGQFTFDNFGVNTRSDIGTAEAAPKTEPAEPPPLPSN